MAKVMTLGDSPGLGAPKKRRRRALGYAASPAATTSTDGECRCTYNSRTKRSARLCFVGKGPKTRSGWIFVKGAATLCKR